MNVASKGRSCAIWHDGALGDLLISFPTMDLIKRSFGGVDIFIARGEPGSFVARLLEARFFLSSDSSDLLSIFSGRVPQPLMDVGKVIFFTRRPEGELASILGSLWGNGLELINTSPQGRVGYGPSLYEQEYAQAKMIFHCTGNFIEHLLSLGKVDRMDYWVLHPGSGGMEKCWPLAHFKALIEAMRHTFPNLEVKIIIGPVEEDRVKEIVSVLEMKGTNFIIDVPLDEVFNILRRSTFYVGNDSGVSHLAALAHTKSFIIFGPTDPATWAPPFPWVHVIAKNGLGPIHKIHVREVVDTIIKTISNVGLEQMEREFF